MDECQRQLTKVCWVKKGSLNSYILCDFIYVTLSKGKTIETKTDEQLPGLSHEETIWLQIDSKKKFGGRGGYRMVLYSDSGITYANLCMY